MKMSIAALHQRYREQTLTPRELVAQQLARIQGHQDYQAWITVLDSQALAPILNRLDGHSPDTLPLFGVPFAIKDNIDLAGVLTTAACPGFAYQATETASLVARLIAAGAIPLGKTNMDQFATGLVGTRSPYGVTRNAFDRQRISGGSSSGSAVAVALGEVTFALGTDTAGSGRVPAAFNNIVGIKPSRGRWSCHGVVPACRSLDCPALFVIDPQDGMRISAVLDGIDPGDPFSRQGEERAFDIRAPRIAVPQAQQLAFFGDSEYPRCFRAALQRWRELGAAIVEVDFTPFIEAAALLYQGPWVAERWLAARRTLEQAPQTLLPVIRDIIDGASGFSATDAFAASYRLAALRQQTDALFADYDLLLVPTAGRHYRIDEVEAEPLVRNTELGFYTNFMNLLDLCALAVPAGMTAQGLPFGITLAAPAFTDQALLQLAQRWLLAIGQPLGACGHHLSACDQQRCDNERPGWGVDGQVSVVVCGAHLAGMPLNHQLLDRGGFLLTSTHTAPCYRLYALPGGPPFRPALVRDEGGAAIEVELWSLPQSAFGSFVAGIPAPLGIGKVELADGVEYCGFIAEPRALQGAREITALASWRAYMAMAGQR